MSDAWRATIRAALLTGSVASAVSTAALMASGWRRLNDPAAPVNGPSQWVFGRGASYRLGFDVPHTLVGYAVHHAMSVFWAAIYEIWLRQRRSSNPLTSAAGTSAIAYLVDYRLIPKRFTPGFENRLPRRFLLMVYGAFAVGLAMGTLIRRRAR